MYQSLLTLNKSGENMNISKIAELAGVSRATVSRYLNNGYVSSINKEKIQKVIEETGYVPSSHAQTLRTKKTHLIGVILPKISSESVSRMVDGISTELSKYNYNILLGNTENSIEKELEYLKIFKTNRVDGIIFIATIITPEHIALMADIKVPIVVLGQQVDGYTCIFHNDYEASLLLTHHLLEEGCKHIAYIGVTPQDIAAGTCRLSGYKKALADAQIPIDENLIQEGAFSFEAGYEHMSTLLDYAHKNDLPLDGVFCATDTIATGALECLKAHNIAVPQTIRIVGIGDSKLSKVLTPKLTTIHYYYKTSGAIAAGHLITELKQADSSVIHEKLGFKIIQRGSSLL